MPPNDNEQNVPPPHRNRWPTGSAAWQWELTDDGSRTLWNAQLNESFHSGCGAVSETLIVYLNNSQVLARLRHAMPCAVLEYGLGTATGLLLTAAVAEHYHTPLVFTALECSLLPNEIFAHLQLAGSVEQCLSQGLARTPTSDPGFALAEFASLPKLAEEFCQHVAVWQQYGLKLKADSATPPLRPTGPLVARLGEFVELQLWLGDARDWSPSDGADAGPATPSHALAGKGRGGFDAIYFDPFSPESNPELWTAEVFEVAASGLRPGGLLTSYCVKSSVRKALQQCGLQVRKMAGPVGGKREVLVAERV